ncbi:hypothetical protein SPRG_14195 [Saprolegnia parasitica CBS 223.65]|uniref:Uncharacterized protein n=1 Tax=Saprolegnia parasitica (strain CBS 223.65) TaxID=695850 RepID=A0A067BZP8_SAPPC|nr:hypothetical protein SPRG_14195 [Saprolegnia parasitica CBS 223.65]KDO20047.1 hypothetical protein SPRG_14195 [Saprolegnia parasitica CBS 223.65]|eukprot:XP_012209281.1 hypothetical protein SPRG_14195 [Saprolegnia parasitica CBS 223.65]
MARCINACETRFGRYSTTILAVFFAVLFIGMMRLVGLYMVLLALAGVLGAAAGVGATLRFHRFPSSTVTSKTDDFISASPGLTLSPAYSPSPKGHCQES